MTILATTRARLVDTSAKRRAATYLVRFATSEADRRAAFRLRFMVFNLELKEGLEGSYSDGYDQDRFDAFCDHLLVEDGRSGEVVGTYRMQTGTEAARNLGFYSEREFDFRPYDPVRREILELGRACVAREHRNFDVLNLLWKGIARHALTKGCRYLIGCSSLTSQDPALGSAMFVALQSHLAEPKLRTDPRPGFACDPSCQSRQAPLPPKLLRAYLSIGAKICGPPAIDREFKTIDFLTLLDLNTLPSGIRGRYLGR